MARQAWVLLLAGCLLGCSTPWISSQSPDNTESNAGDDPSDKVRLVGDVAVSIGRDAIAVEGVGLVVNLDNTGSDPPPSVYRTRLLDEMRKREIDDPQKLLASPSTALVLVRGFLRPGVQQGDLFDVEVRVPGQSETTSLRGGFLLPTRLTETAAVDGVPHYGNLEAVAKGPVMVDAVGAAQDNAGALKQGRVLGGGVAMKSHSLALLLKPDFQQVKYSAWVGHAVNRRFHYYTKGDKEDIAKPRDNEIIVLKLHPRYKENVPRFLRVVQSLPLQEAPAQQIERIKLLERQLLDPLTAATAALRLEAAGPDGVPSMLKGIASPNPEVRFYAAEALAYMDHEKSSAAAVPLAEAARSEPAFRVFALTALSAINEFEATEQLRLLLNAESAETRYGAFRALWAANRNDPLVQGELLGNQFSLHVLNTEGPQMIHVTRSFRPEIVLFGGQIEFQSPLLLDAGNEIRVQAPPGGAVTISRVSLNQADQRHQVSPRVEQVIRRVVELGGTYPDVVQMLRKAAASGALPNCRLEEDAVPQAGRSYARDGAPPPEAPQFAVRNPLPNLFSSVSRGDAPEKRRDMTGRTESKTGKSELSKLWGWIWPWK
jgi:hypothetical protein